MGRRESVPSKQNAEELLCKHSRKVFLGVLLNESLTGTRHWGKNSMAFVWTGELKMMFVVN